MRVGEIMRNFILLMVLLIAGTVFAEEGKIFTDKDLGKYQRVRKVPISEEETIRYCSIAAIYIKARMHNPNSFVVVNCSIKEIDSRNMVVNMQYRGTNAYGGIVTNSGLYYFENGQIINAIEQ
jgi:deoxyadenosine/deoxycytidine kinase